MAEFTIKYSESVKGFPSFFSFLPDWMGGMNNRFYSVKDGQLYIHDDTNNATRNNFYGVQYPSSLKTIVNKAPSDIKVAKAINIEGNKALDTTIRGYLNDEESSITESTVDVGEFLNKEGTWHAYVRRNELTGDLTAKSAYGLGTVTNTVASTFLVLNAEIPTALICIGDSIYNSSNVLLGVIENYDISTKTIEINAPATQPAGTFIYGLKDGRIEGSEIRGYNFEIDLVDNTTSRTELYAVSTGVFKSSP